MKHRLGGIVVAGALVAAVSAMGASRAAAQDVDYLDRAVTAWSKVKTVRATFEQVLRNPLTGRSASAAGEYQQQRPGKLAILFSDPAGDKIIADGKFVWLYLPSTVKDQVFKSPQGEGGTGTVDLTAQFLTEPRTKFTVNGAGTLMIAGRHTHGYTLIPKVAGSTTFIQAAVWIDDEEGSIKQFEVVEPGNVQRKIKILTYKTNVPVDEKAFVFTPTATMKVVTK
ncbi:MAG: outer-membrane lipoprotein carrier protein LolA [bacterium]